MEIYAEGICSMSVCVLKGWDRSRIEGEANRRRPTGIKSRWKISEDLMFRTGQPNPNPCEHDCARLHYLLAC
jgi:hypothetical protein